MGRVQTVFDRPVDERLINDALVSAAVGSMFWFRPQSLSTLLDFDFLIEEFPEETGQTDGTLAHAIERSFLFVVDHNNHRHKAIG